MKKSVIGCVTLWIGLRIFLSVCQTVCWSIGPNVCVSVCGDVCPKHALYPRCIVSMHPTRQMFENIINRSQTALAFNEYKSCRNRLVGLTIFSTYVINQLKILKHSR